MCLEMCLEAKHHFYDAMLNLLKCDPVKHHSFIPLMLMSLF